MPSRSNNETAYCQLAHARVHTCVILPFLLTLTLSLQCVIYLLNNETDKASCLLFLQLLMQVSIEIFTH